MRALSAAALLLATVAAAGGPFDADKDPDADAVAGHVGPSAASLRAQGLYTLGAAPTTSRPPGALGAAPTTFTQGGAEAVVDFAWNFRPTTLRGLVGVEGELALEGMQSEVYADGTVRDQRSASAAADPPKVWMTFRAGGRAAVSLPTLRVGRVTGRLVAVGGVQLEAHGARSWAMGGAFTAGAHLSVSWGWNGFLVSWLAIPPQGAEVRLVSHRLSLDVGLGAFVLGGRLQFDHVDQLPGDRGLPPTVDAMTIGVSLGWRTPSIKL